MGVYGPEIPPKMGVFRENGGGPSKWGVFGASGGGSWGAPPGGGPGPGGPPGGGLGIPGRKWGREFLQRKGG